MVGTQHAFLSFAHSLVDGPRDATLHVDEEQPTAIGPRTRSQSRRAAKNMSAQDRHSSYSSLHDPSRNEHSDHHESNPCTIVSALTVRDVRIARRAARASVRLTVRPSAHTSPTSSDFFAALVARNDFTTPPYSDFSIEHNSGI